MAHRHIAAWAIGGMVLAAGGIVAAVLIRDARPPKALPESLRPISDQRAAAPESDIIPLATPPAPSTALQAQCTLLSAGWRCGHATTYETLDWWQCEVYVGGVRLLAAFNGDDELKSFSFMGMFPSGIAAETAARVWEVCTDAAASVLPGAGLAIAEARQSAIEQPHGLAGSARTQSDWQIWTLERLDEIRYAEWAAEGNLVVSIEAMAPAVAVVDEDLGIEP